MRKPATPWWVWLLPLPLVWWAALLVAMHWDTSGGFGAFLMALNAAMAAPFQIQWCDQSRRFVVLATLAYAVTAVILANDIENTRYGEEHGSARWGDVFEIAARYRARPRSDNLILTENFRIGLDTYKHKRNLNVLVVGGSGAGKSRSHAIPNVLQGCCSYVITDPKGEILRKTGGALERMGYEVRVFDLIDPDSSFCYNPFAYVRDDKDVLKLISNLIRNTTPKNSTNNDPFWEKSETALLQALMLYLIHYAPEEEQNFAMVMEMLLSAEVKEEDEGYESPLDILFNRVAEKDPESLAVKQYAIYKQAAGKTAKSILVSVGVRLAAFNLPQIAKLTMTDELGLDTIGEKKVALFCCIPDGDTSLNYLVGMIYTQLFQTLFHVADRKYKGALPVHVHCIMDEFPNVAQPDAFPVTLSVARSRGCSVSICIQNIAQLKALYKDEWESIVGNCDSLLYLGGNEQATHKLISELIGKETIATRTYNQSKGRNGSYSINRQQTGRDLMTPDEVRLLSNNKAVLFIRGERPVLDDKFVLAHHPNVKYTEDGGADPYDYTKADQAADDLPRAEQLELLDPADFTS